jgi:hypothetical protein
MDLVVDLFDDDGKTVPEQLHAVAADLGRFLGQTVRLRVTN